MHLKVLWILILVYAALRGALFYAQYHGSPSPELRKLAEQHFTSEDVDRGSEYSRRGFWVRIAWTALEVSVLLIAVFSGLSGWLSDRSLAAAGDRWLLQTALFAAALSSGFFLLRLPFEYYFGYLLEHRFGFSTQTLGGWSILQAKSLGVFLVFSVVGAVLWIGVLRLFPRAWVLVVPIGFTLLEAFLSLVLPVILLPIFYEKSPLPPGPFREKVTGLLEKAGIESREIYVVDQSRYSTHTNAFFAGLGPTKNIYLYDTLLKDHSENEALTVVAHEAGHWRGRHILKGIVLGGLGLLLGCILLACLYPRLAAEGGAGWRPLKDPGSICALLLLSMLAGFITSPVASAVSRYFERESDRAALELTGDGASLVSSQVRLVRANRAQLLPHPLVVFWYYTHPPALERIEAAGR